MDEHDMRMALIEAVQQVSASGYSLQHGIVLEHASQGLGIRGSSPKGQQELLLTAWYDLFREGILSWGVDLNGKNSEFPFCHFTDRGHRFLNNASRDPRNLRGYMAYLDKLTTVDPIARSYIEEALHTFQNECWKATAVMAGGAAERLALLVRDTLVARLDATNKMAALNQGTRDNLRNWRISRVLDAIERVLDPYTPNMPQGLQEAYTTFWSQFSGQARLVRNDAGHPKSVDPVDEPTVHGVLLMFPTHAKLAADLVAWMPTGVV
jgi:hypothetical protein